MVVQGGHFPLHIYQDASDWTESLLDCIDEEGGTGDLKVKLADHLGVATQKFIKCKSCDNTKEAHGGPHHQPFLLVTPAKDVSINELVKSSFAETDTGGFCCPFPGDCRSNDTTNYEEVCQSSNLVVVHVKRVFNQEGTPPNLTPISLKKDLSLNEKKYVMMGAVVYVHPQHYVFYGYNIHQRRWIKYDDSTSIPLEVPAPHLDVVKKGCTLLLYRELEWG